MTKLLAITALTGALASGDLPDAPLAKCGFKKKVGNKNYECGGILGIGALGIDINIPEQCMDGGCGLIVDVHGLIMSADIQNRNTNMRSLGEQNDFVVMQPTAPGAPPFTSWSSAEDSKIYDATVEIRDLLDIDPLRFHMMGFSQGAQMTWRFLTRHADELASIAPISFTPSWGRAGPPEIQIPVLFAIGTKDGFVNFKDSQNTADQLIAAWKFGNGTVIQESDKHTWTRYTNDIGNTFEFLHHDYSDTCFPYPFAGHCFPGSTDTCNKLLPLGQIVHFSCSGEAAYNTGEEVMKFFIAHPKTSLN